jgi:hypothetical protein
MSNVSEELKEVRAQADKLGISYHHKAGVAKIKALIDAQLDTLEEQSEEDNTQEKERIVPMTAVEYKKERAKTAARESNRLVRCRITCMNPAKREWEGEIISVGSSKHGTFKKFIPFDQREWHVPKIIFDHLKERKCTVYTNAKNAKGQTIRQPRLIDEFAIEVLPPLTKKELADLRQKQALANGQVNV